MIWLTWRQFRAGAITGVAAIAALAVTLGVIGANLAHLYDTSGIPGCHAHGDCRAVASSFLNHEQSDHVYAMATFLGIAVVLITPAIIGMFWGAPLIAREIEAGTFRLAWNQSVTRNRWIAVKLIGVGLAAMATAGLLSLITTWWASPLYRANVLAGSSSPLSVGRFTPVVFAGQGIVPIGYAAFAFVLGVAAGVLIRRTVPAMATTLAAFTAVQLAWPALVRPHLIEPVRTITALGRVTFSAVGESQHGLLFLRAGGGSGVWVLSSQPVNAAGHAVARVPAACQRAFSSQVGAFLSCLSRQGVKIAVTYQPDSRYWDFQWIELGAFLVLAGLLAWFCVRRVTRRFA